jgi:hypothetical protein
MSTRLRDWMIVGVALAIVFGVSLQAPRVPDGVAHYRTPPSTSDPHITPSVAPAGYRRSSRPTNVVPPFPVADPRPMILYYPPGFSR